MKEKAIKMAKCGLGALFLYRAKAAFRNRFLGPVIYDSFASRRKRAVCVIAPHYSLSGLKGARCIYRLKKGAEVSVPARIVDDRERHTLIVLFDFPEGTEGEFSYSVRKGSREICAGSCDKPDTERRFKLAIATLFKYEVEFLREWIEHHLDAGVEHFYIYENNAKPDQETARVLGPFIERGLVTLTLWPYPYKLYDYRLRQFWPLDSYSYCQMPQINHALYKFGDEAEWILSCDVDEYFFSPQGDRVIDVLKDIAREDTAVISVQGIWFGGSVEDGERALREGVRRAYVRSERNPTSSPKCFLNTDRVGVANVHDAVSFRGVEVKAPFDRLRFNHYRGISWKRRVSPGGFAVEAENSEILRD